MAMLMRRTDAAEWRGQAAVVDLPPGVVEYGPGVWTYSMDLVVQHWNDRRKHPARKAIGWNRPTREDRPTI